MFSTEVLREKAEKHLDGTQDDVDQAIFLHFLQLEDMTKSVRDMKMRTKTEI